MKEWWRYRAKHFSEIECSKIIELARTIPTEQAKIGYGAANTQVVSNYRRSTVRWLPRYDSRFQPLFNALTLIFHEANSSAFGFDLTLFHEVQFTEYHSENQGTYDWHHDTLWATERLAQRKLSLVVQLSDPNSYEGGDLEFCKEECHSVPAPTDLRSQGTVIVFPSFLKHRVTPVTAGLRYSLVTWHDGPNFR